jgi:hypothetical protein
MSLELHEAGHVQASILYSKQGEAVTVFSRQHELETVPTSLPASAEEVIDQGLAGAFAELLEKAKFNVLAARTAIQVVGWQVALRSDASVLDFELLGPMLTQATVLESFDRIAHHLEADALRDIAARIGALEIGESTSFARKLGH